MPNKMNARRQSLWFDDRWMDADEWLESEIAHDRPDQREEIARLEQDGNPARLLTDQQLAEQSAAPGGTARASSSASGAIRLRHTRGQHMDFSKQVKPDMRVVGSDDAELARVDGIESMNSIKLKKDSKGQHHYIPMSWVSSVDDKVHLDRPIARATTEWKTTV